jgi:tRNA threonylcarbamoyladenosine biosynthesis protein TsaB
VGMAAAKGFCYALKIPLITHNTLRVMAESMKEVAKEKGCWVSPMIDARRDEVFTAIYDSEMNEILEPQAMILDKNSFEKQLSQNQISFYGTGAAKWKEIQQAGAGAREPSDMMFLPQPGIGQSVAYRSQPMARLSETAFLLKNFADIVYSEPVYLKEFFSY